MSDKLRRHHGFTLLELLIVISVIAILTGILVVTAKSITNSSKMRQTKVTLGTLQGMLTNLDAQTKLRGQPAGWVWPGQSNVLAPGGAADLDFWRVPYRANLNDPSDTLDGPGPVSDAPDDPIRHNRNADPAILNTSVAMGLMLAIPANRDVIGKTQANIQFVPIAPAPGAVEYPPGSHVMTLDTSNGKKRYFVCTNPAGTTSAPPGGGWTEETLAGRSVPLLLDGWGNPIIFVPAGGMKVYLSNDTTGNFFVVKSPDNRPFFASAGPDGIFGYADVNNNKTYDLNVDKPGGDDNVYSFQ